MSITKFQDSSSSFTPNLSLPNLGYLRLSSSVYLWGHDLFRGASFPSLKSLDIQLEDDGTNDVGLAVNSERFFNLFSSCSSSLTGLRFWDDGPAEVEEEEEEEKENASHDLISLLHLTELNLLSASTRMAKVLQFLQLPSLEGVDLHFPSSALLQAISTSSSTVRAVIFGGEESSFSDDTVLVFNRPKPSAFPQLKYVNLEGSAASALGFFVCAHLPCFGSSLDASNGSLKKPSEPSES